MFKSMPMPWYHDDTMGERKTMTTSTGCFQKTCYPLPFETLQKIIRFESF